MKALLTGLLIATSTITMAQTYEVPVSEAHEPMAKGQYEPTWESLEKHETPEWFRNAMQYWDINVHTGAVMQEPSK